MNQTSDNPVKVSRNLRIAQLRLEGLSVIDIAKQVDISHQQVSNIINSKVVSQRIQDGVKEQALMLPLTNEVYWHALSHYKDDTKLAVDVSHKVQANLGIAATRTDNPLVAKYITINNVNLVDPGLQAAFSQHFGGLSSTADSPDEAIEAEWTDDNRNSLEDI